MNKRLITTLSIGILSLSMLVGCSDSESNNVIEDNNIVKEEKYEYVHNLDMIEYLEDESKVDKEEDKLKESIRQEHIYYCILNEKIKEYITVMIDKYDNKEFGGLDKLIKEVQNVKSDLERHKNIKKGVDEIKEEHLEILGMIEDEAIYINEGYENDDNLITEEEKFNAMESHLGFIIGILDESKNKRIELFEDVEI